MAVLDIYKMGAENRRALSESRAVLCEVELRKPRLLVDYRGNAAGAANRGRLFFEYFILATQKKVFSCRSATGELVWF